MTLQKPYGLGSPRDGHVTNHHSLLTSSMPTRVVTDRTHIRLPTALSFRFPHRANGGSVPHMSSVGKTSSATFFRAPPVCSGTACATMLRRRYDPPYVCTPRRVRRTSPACFWRDESPLTARAFGRRTRILLPSWTLSSDYIYYGSGHLSRTFGRRWRRQPKKAAPEKKATEEKPVSPEKAPKEDNLRGQPKREGRCGQGSRRRHLKTAACV